jgi:small-conductance mechanosensitive channel
VTIILGFALREIGENFCAGILLSINKPFKIGDTIKSLDVEGKVKSIEIRHTHIRSFDGKDIYVPSSQIYKNTLINYTKDGLRRFDFVIGIDYSSDIKKACLLIDEELIAINGILKDPAPECVVKGLLPSYIEIIVYFWINIHDNITLKKIKEDTISNIKDKLIAEKFVLSNNSSNHNINVHHEDKK